jgi:hypothetical protein
LALIVNKYVLLVDKREREREREQLQQAIKELENKPHKTAEEEQELTAKKKRLAELNRPQDSTRNNNS